VSLRKLIDDDWKLDNADKAEFVLTDPNTTTTVRFERNNNDQLYYLSGIRASGHDVEEVHSLTTKPVTLDINIAHGLLGHPDTRTVKAMAARQNWTLTGSVLPSGLCALAKARAKAVPKTTLTKAKLPGERMNYWDSILEPLLVLQVASRTKYSRESPPELYVTVYEKSHRYWHHMFITHY
jgi:hypothetical protein